METVSKGSDYQGQQKEVVVLSVIIGEETEVIGVRACLTWKPLSVLTLMGRLKKRDGWMDVGGRWWGVKATRTTNPPL